MSMWKVKPKGCKKCGSTAHTAFRCPWSPRKRLNPRGKHFNKWVETRNRWLEANKAPFYFCYICNKMLTRTQLTLDHIESRSRRPELRYVLRNLAPCCLSCNRDKGSLSLEEYLEKVKGERRMPS